MSEEKETQQSRAKEKENEFIEKHKKELFAFFNDLIMKYIRLLRPDAKIPMVEPIVKNQLAFILYRLIMIAKRADDNPTEPIEDLLPTTSFDYMLYRYLKGVTENQKYTTNDDVDIMLTNIISMQVVEQDVITNMIELYVLFMRRLSEAIAGLCWLSSKRIKNEIINGILRILDTRNTNPFLFSKIHNLN